MGKGAGCGRRCMRLVPASLLVYPVLVLVVYTRVVQKVIVVRRPASHCSNVAHNRHKDNKDGLLPSRAYRVQGIFLLWHTS